MPWPVDVVRELSTAIGGKEEEAANSSKEAKVVMRKTKDTAYTPKSSKVYKRGNVSNIFKAYSTEEEKYSGSFTDNFDRKLVLFQNRFDQIDVPNHNRTRAFSFIQKGDVLQYYFDNSRQNNMSFNDLIQAMKDRSST